MRELTIKQKKFADEYIKTGNAYHSAVNAGYSHNYAKGNVVKLLENVSVKNYVEKQMRKIEDRQIAKAEEVLMYLTRVIRDEEEEINTTIIDGEIMNFKTKPKISDKTRAAELIGKRYALFTEKTEVSGSIEVDNKMAGLTTEELRALAKGVK